MKIEQTQKNVYIMQTNPGRLANQLWNYACVYAYCLERGYACKNPSFFRYAHYFEGTKLEAFGKAYMLIRWPKVFSIIYSIISRMSVLGKNIISTDTEFLLPPSENTNKRQDELLKKAEQSENIYLHGWLFRNPAGLKKFHKEITSFFRPKFIFRVHAESIIAEARQMYTHCIGVHLRQGDYRVWEGGKHYVTPERAAAYMKKFIESKGLDKEKTCFIICSDESVDENIFEGLHIYKGPGTEIEDLYVLSLTDGIIGSHSTYGPWAAYVGGIPFTEFAHI